VEIWKMDDTLVPVRDHTVHSSGLAVDGLSMLAAYSIATRKTTLDRAWFDLVIGDLASDLHDSDDLSCSYDELVHACEITQTWPGRLPGPVQRLPLKLMSIEGELSHFSGG
jgi:hypothetical protein